MIHWPRDAVAPVPRLMAALAARGHAGVPTSPEREPDRTPSDVRVVCLRGAAALDTERRGNAGGLVLVIGWIGTHPDARHPWLRRLWSLEEGARGGGGRVLVLRLAPLVGPTSPLWHRLARPARLGHRGRKLLQPVLEGDVVETVVRALDGRAIWEGWYEVCGPDVYSLAELADLAAAAGAAEKGTWEPPLGVLEEQGLADPTAWREHFGIAPRPLGAAFPALSSRVPA
jgi:uncharacterized protein YbjT (DUF2867 family)